MSKEKAHQVTATFSNPELVRSFWIRYRRIGKAQKDLLKNKICLESEDRTEHWYKIFENILRGISSTMDVSPGDKVDVSLKNNADLIRRSWLRTGNSVELALNEYDDDSQTLDDEKIYKVSMEEHHLSEDRFEKLNRG